MSLPAVAGVEGVGVVLATAQNVPMLKDYALEVKDWDELSSADPMGACVINLEEYKDARGQPTRRWYELEGGEGAVEGVCCSPCVALAPGARKEERSLPPHPPPSHTWSHNPCAGGRRRR